jgi:hypothetical protein
MRKLLSFFRKPVKPEPPLRSPGNPGRGTSFTTATSGRANPEHVDLVEITERVLRQFGHEVQREDGWLWHRPTGMTFVPQVLDVNPAPSGGAATVRPSRGRARHWGLEAFSA